MTTEPSDDELTRAENRANARAAAAGAPITDGALADGTAVPLLANLGNPAGAAEAVALGAEGVGLFRTEFLFLSASSAPTVEQQRASYAELLAAFADSGKALIIPRYGDRRGHPVIATRAVLQKMMALPPQASPKDVIHAHRSETEFIDVDDRGILRDIDFPSDYDKLTGEQ